MNKKTIIAAAAAGAAFGIAKTVLPGRSNLMTVALSGAVSAVAFQVVANKIS